MTLPAAPMMTVMVMVMVMMMAALVSVHWQLTLFLPADADMQATPTTGHDHPF